MKVVHLSSAHAPFDTRIFSKECRTLFDAGHDVTLIVPHDANELVNGVRILAVPKPRSRRERMTRTVWEVVRSALEIAADVYHFHDPELLFVAPRLKLRGAGIIYDVHEDLPAQIRGKHWVAPWLRIPLSAGAAAVEQVVARSVLNRVIAATPAIAARFPLVRTVIVQNFPILGELAVIDAPPQEQRPRLVAYVGVISEGRGIREMIQSMPLLADLGVRLVLAGSFSPSDLETRMRRLSGWQHVEFLGYQSRKQVAELLARARAGVVLFHPEPNHVKAQPNKLFEYMSAALPVVASDFPLWREIVQGSRCGLLADPLNPMSIAASIRQILQDPKLADRMGSSGRLAVQEKYNWMPEGKKLLAAYEGLKR